MTTKPALTMAERLQLALEAAEDAFALTDAQGHVRWSNRRFDSLVERPHAMVLGRPVSDLVGRRTLKPQNTWLTLDGEDTRICLVALRPPAETEDQFRMLVEGVKDYALVMLDEAGRVVSWNKGAERLKGYKAEEIIGKNVRCFYPAEELASGVGPEKALREAAATGRVECDGVWRLRKDGTRFLANIVIAAVRGDDGRLRGFAVVTRDVTESHLRTQELARSNAELDRFASSASHDLLEPLRKITAFGEILERHAGAALDAKGLDFLRRMRNAAARMTRLVEDLLQYSRVFGDDAPLQPVDLNAVAADVLSDYEAKIASVDARVDVGPLPTLHAQRFQMHQLIQNLLDNALKFRKPDRPAAIFLSAQPAKPGFVELVMTDNGIGIDPKDAERVFQPFVRLHTRAEFEGTGLGLALCRRIVTRHGGWIRAQCSPGGGCRLIVTLPVRSQA